jgi:hypothetical protein
LSADSLLSSALPSLSPLLLLLVAVLSVSLAL